MRVLFLGPGESPLLAVLDQHDDVEQTVEPIKPAWPRPDLIVSYGYTHILGSDILDWVAGNAINLHISMLPWNRGSDPNLWSFLENTPCGVSIHYMDTGIDTGDLIAQREVHFTGEETLRGSYELLQTEIQRLFRELWPDIRAGRVRRIPQPGGGSYHRQADKDRFAHFLTHGWDTPIKEIVGAGLRRSR